MHTENLETEKLLKARLSLWETRRAPFSFSRKSNFQTKLGFFFIHINYLNK